MVAETSHRSEIRALDTSSTESESLFLMVVVAFVAMWFNGVVIEATSGLDPPTPRIF